MLEPHETAHDGCVPEREKPEMPPIFLRSQDEMEPRKEGTKIPPAGRVMFPMSERQAEYLQVAPPGSTSINKSVQNKQHVSRTLLGTPWGKKKKSWEKKKKSREIPLVQNFHQNQGHKNRGRQFLNETAWHNPAEPPYQHSNLRSWAIIIDNSLSVIGQLDQ